MRNVRLRNKHKLTDKWESAVYNVLKQMGDLPVYMVQPVSEDSPIRTLHRDLLLPCGYLAEAEEDEQDQPKSIRRPRTRHSYPQLQEEELCESEDECTVHPVEASVFTEERFTKVYDIQKQRDVSANPPGESDMGKTLPPVLKWSPLQAMRWQCRLKDQSHVLKRLVYTSQRVLLSNLLLGNGRSCLSQAM